MTVHKFDEGEIRPYQGEGNATLMRMLRKTANDLTDDSLRLHDFDVTRSRDVYEKVEGGRVKKAPGDTMTVTIEMEYEVDL